MNKRFRMSPVEINNFTEEMSALYGDMNKSYLERISELIGLSLDESANIFAFRVDLRFTNPEAGCPDSPVCFQNTDEQVIKRFIESLESQLAADEHRRRGRGLRVHPNNLKYVWVREQNESELQHYHVVIILNKAAYYSLGDFMAPEPLAGKIQQAWWRAVGLDYPDYRGLVEFPENGGYWLSRESVYNRYLPYMEFMQRAAYLAKEKTKIRGAGYRCFGSSQVGID